MLKIWHCSSGTNHVTQSCIYNLNEVNLLSSLTVTCLGVDTISLKIFKLKVSQEVIKELIKLNVEYPVTLPGCRWGNWNTHTHRSQSFLGYNSTWMYQIAVGVVAQNSKLGYIICGACWSECRPRPTCKKDKRVTGSTYSLLYYHICCISSSSG